MFAAKVVVHEVKAKHRFVVRRFLGEAIGEPSHPTNEVSHAAVVAFVVAGADSILVRVAPNLRLLYFLYLGGAVFDCLILRRVTEYLDDLPEVDPTGQSVGDSGLVGVPTIAAQMKVPSRRIA